MTGALKMRFRSDARARSARGLSFGATAGGACVQPATSNRLAAATRPTAASRRSQRNKDHKEFFVISVTFVAFMTQPPAVTDKLLQRVNCFEDPVQGRRVDLGGGVAVAAGER